MSKRRGDCHTSSNRKQKACKSIGKTNSTFEEEFKTSSDTDQVSCGEHGGQALSGLSTCVAALASFNGKRMHYACSGTVLKNTRFGISILTSGNLVRSPDDASKFSQMLRIEVLLPNYECATLGFLKHYDFHYNVAVICTNYHPGVEAACIDPDFQIGYHSKVVAAGRDFNSGKFMTTSGITTETRGLSSDELMISTCEITECYIGGPLFDSDGKFVGTNYYDEQLTPFIPFNIICKRLVHALAIRVGIKQGRDNTTERHTSEVENYNVPSLSALEGTSSGKSRCGGLPRSFPLKQKGGEGQNNNQKPSMASRRSRGRRYYEIVDTNIERRPTFVPLPANEYTASLAKKLGPQGYPMPITLEGGMRLLHTFEKEFARDIWSTLTKEVAFNTSQNVVSLASFCGEKRFFACTGVLIGRRKSTTRVLTSASLVRKVDSNEIADNLTIQVYLPNNRRAKGTLQYYNMNHNIALISIRGFHCHRTAKFNTQVQVEPGKEVVAIGRVFETGKLMATGGALTGESKLDCRQLMISTCKITKAGIGGPLIDFGGNFIGMNFYDGEETPYLPRSTILELLKQIDGKGIVADEEVIDKAGLYRWPVPEPCWHYPSTIVRVYAPGRIKQ